MGAINLCVRDLGAEFFAEDERFGAVLFGRESVREHLRAKRKEGAGGC